MNQIFFGYDLRNQTSQVFYRPYDYLGRLDLGF